MKNFPIDLTTLTLHIHSQFEKILDNKSFSDRMCGCRKLIFEQFTVAVEKMIIKLGARTLKFLEDYNLELSTDLDDLEKWFFDDVYQSLYENEEVSNKMVLVFQQLQHPLDQKFFDIISKRFNAILVCLKEGNHQYLQGEMNDLYEEIQGWYELFIYLILSTQLNCQSLNDKFLEDNEIPKSRICEGEENSCIHCDAANRCEVHAGVAQNGEIVRMIMTDEFIEDMTWMDTLISIINKYHNNPDNISLILDYRMYDQLIQCKLKHVHYDKILKASTYFKHLQIVNHEGINFNGYFQRIKHLVK